MTSANNIRTLLTAFALMAAVPAILQACASDVEPENTQTPPTGDQQQVDDDAVCMLNNCVTDEQCAGCEDGRDTCMVDENRCVACNPVTGKGCPEGESCSPYGLCVPNGQTCDTDKHGEPTITCASPSSRRPSSPSSPVTGSMRGRATTIGSWDG